MDIYRVTFLLRNKMLIYIYRSRNKILGHTGEICAGFYFQ